MKTNESTLTGEPIHIYKAAGNNIFLLSGRSVSEGVGAALLVAVGERSQWCVTLKAIIVDPGEIPLLQRLDVLAWSISKLGFLFASLSFMVSMFWCISDSSRISDRDTTKLLEFFTGAVTIVVVTNLRASPRPLP